MSAPARQTGIAATTRLDPAKTVLVIATTLVGLSAGFFHAYESSVTRGLALIDDVSYVAAMNAVNGSVRNAVFGVAFFGGLLSSAAALVVHLSRGPQLRTVLVAVAAGLYLATVAITATVNVPLNERLEAGVAAGDDVVLLRAEYEPAWNAANRLRTITAAGSLLSFVLALSSPPRARALPAAGTDTRRRTGR